MLKKCNICPHNCNIDRTKGEIGRCKSGNYVKIALVSLHNYEEPCISGKNGSGTIFFSNCNLQCKYCQNYEISHLGKGWNVTVEELSDIFIQQQKDGAHNINLVTPTMYVYQIIRAIQIAKKNGLTIPIIYNTNGYENVETIKKLNGYIDVYLPDLKYYSNELAKKYSNINNYFEYATKAIKEMYNQVGEPVINRDGLIEKGLIIRHLILPNYLQNTKNILRWIKDNLPSNVYVSVMAQYFPCFKAIEDDKICRKLTINEYKKIEKYIYSIGLENGYLQDLEENELQYVPKF